MSTPVGPRRKASSNFFSAAGSFCVLASAPGNMYQPGSLIPRRMAMVSAASCGSRLMPVSANGVNMCQTKVTRKMTTAPTTVPIRICLLITASVRSIHGAARGSSDRPTRFHPFYHEGTSFPYTVGMTLPVRVTRGALEAVLAHARREPGMECCGLLAGRAGVITTVLPAKNALGSATAFEIAPAELFALFRHMRAHGLDHLGIYHSHPAVDNAPSPRDIERAYYPDAAY